MAQDRGNAKDAARQATRTALLDAATRLLFRSPAADPIGALRPMEVVRAADPPRSNGAFYNIWPTQAAFRRDLLHHVLSPARSEVGARTTYTAAERLSAGPDVSVEEAFRVAANLNFDGLRQDTSLRLKHALWTRHETDPEVRQLLAGLYEGVTDLFVPVYEAALTRAQRRMRQPYTVEHLATTLTALGEGLYTRWAVHPRAVPDDLGPPPAAATAGAPTDERTGEPAGEPVGGPEAHERWTFFASIAFTTFMAMTEPVAPGARAVPSAPSAPSG
jgi:AcrR family transcriptional regulator